MALLDGKQIKPGSITEDRLAPGVGGGVPSKDNKGMVASATVADFDPACATALANTPFFGSYVGVDINGAAQHVGDGVKTADCYFSGDAGVTARAFTAIVAGDLLYWVGSVAGFQLAVSDRVSFNYDV